MAKARRTRRCVYITRARNVDSEKTYPTWAQAKGACKKLDGNCKVVKMCFDFVLRKTRRGVYTLGVRNETRRVVK